MNEQETTADIIAAMRGGPIPQHRHDRVLLCHFADRLEAAHKRDHEYTKAQSLDADKLTGKNISGLVTELRQIAKYHYARGNIVQGQFARVMADRIEAAHKREMSKNASKNGADFGQLVDVAKLREAISTLRTALKEIRNDVLDMVMNHKSEDPDSYAHGLCLSIGGACDMALNSTKEFDNADK